MTSRPGFTIETDPARRLIRVTMRGFWDEATVAAYDKEIQIAGAATMAAARCARHELLALVDARELAPQSQELLAKFRDRFLAPERQPKRNATLVSSALLKRQAERIAPPNQRIFEGEREHEAMEWLLAD